MRPGSSTSAAPMAAGAMPSVLVPASDGAKGTRAVASAGAAAACGDATARARTIARPTPPNSAHPSATATTRLPRRRRGRISEPHVLQAVRVLPEHAFRIDLEPVDDAGHLVDLVEMVHAVVVA